MVEAFAFHAGVGDNAVYLRFSGPVDMAACEEYLDMAERLIVQTNRRQLICDHRRSRWNMGAVQFRQLVELMASSKALQPLRVAVLDNRRSNNLVFMESIAALMGLSLRVFTDLAKAEGWLAQVLP